MRVQNAALQGHIYDRGREFDHPELRRRLVPLQARLGRLLRRGQDKPDQNAYSAAID